MTLSVFLLALGASARLTRLVTDDAILGRFRTWFIRRWGPDHWTSYLLHCPWCVSPYLGAGVFTTAWFYGDTPWFIIVASVLSASWLIGTAASYDAAGDA